MKNKTTIKEHTISRLPIFIVGTIVLTLSLMQLFGVSSSVASRFIEKESPKNEMTVPTTSGIIPTHIKISKANIDLPIVPVKMQNGTWKVNDGVANYAVETSKISEKDGNVGLFAHDLQNGFSRIKTLVVGDLIEVMAGDHIATYKVVSKHITNPSDVDAFYPTKNPTLTLVTCDGAFSEQRLIVKANLISLKEGNNAK